MRLLLAILALACACACDPRPPESYQVGDQWCTPLADGTITCEPLDGEIEVR